MEIVALSRQLAVSPIAVIVIGESCLKTTSIEMISFPFALSLTGTFTSSPGLASQLPKSNSILAADAFLFAATSSTSSILTLGCEADILPAALTDEANALVMSDKPMTTDVTAESSFFISAFPFRALRSIEF